MRIPVFARGSNPRIDRPILRKSIFYGFEQVKNLLAEWVDPNDSTKGIIAREFLPSGKRVETVETSGFDFTELPGIRVIPAKMEKNPTLPRLQVEPLEISASGWDWDATA